MKTIRPNTFNDIIGQQGPVAELRARVLKRDRTQGVILHGPDGVGKRTLARLLAKALLCDSIRDGGIPCGTCLACSTSGPEGSLGITTFDATEISDDDFSEVTISEARRGKLVGGHVLIMDRADEIQPRRFDRLLKTLEEPKTKTTFILLASNINKIRLAGQSRCASYRLKPLDEADAGQFIGTLCALNGFDWDPSLVEIILGAGRGFPADLTSAAAKLARSGVKQRPQAIAALGLDWPSRVIAHWRAVLQQGRPLESLLGRPSGLRLDKADDTHAVWSRHLGAFLLYFHLQTLRGMPLRASIDPALNLIDEKSVDEIADLWRARAASEGASSDALWERLCALAVADEFEPLTLEGCDLSAPLGQSAESR
jgi:hypothetical protein